MLRIHWKLFVPDVDDIPGHSLSRVCAIVISKVLVRITNLGSFSSFEILQEFQQVDNTIYEA